jgi:hypothetical protein
MIEAAVLGFDRTDWNRFAGAEPLIYSSFSQLQCA